MNERERDMLLIIQYVLSKFMQIKKERTRSAYCCYKKEEK